MPSVAIVKYTQVSIHAPRAERDAIAVKDMRYMLRFNPRAPGGARLPFYKGMKSLIDWTLRIKCFKNPI